MESREDAGEGLVRVAYLIRHDVSPSLTHSLTQLLYLKRYM